MPFSQRDIRWSDEIMGGGNYTLGAKGCFEVALCSGLVNAGYNFDPHTLNIELKNRGLWDENSYIDVANLSTKWPEIFTSFNRIDPYADIPPIDSFLNENIIVLCRVDARGIGGAGTHFVLLTGVDKGISLIADSWTGTIDLVTKRYHDYGNILGLRIFLVKPAIIKEVDMITDQTKISLGGDLGDMEVQAIRSTLLDQKKNIDALAKAKEDLLLAKQQSDSEAKLWKDKHDTFVAVLAKMLNTTQDEARIIPEIDTLIKKEDKLTAIVDNRPISSATPMHKLLEELIVLIKKLLKKYGKKVVRK